MLIILMCSAEAVIFSFKPIVMYCIWRLLMQVCFHVLPIQMLRRQYYNC